MARERAEPRKGGPKKSKATPQPGARLTGAIVRKFPTHKARESVDVFIRRVSAATPIEIVEVERSGVPGLVLKQISRYMDVPSSRVYDMVGVAKSTAEAKAAEGEVIAGSGGHAAIGLARLIALAQEIVADSTAPDAKDFDAAKWLGRWLELPQPALGGRKPAELLDTPTGLEVVRRLLGSIASGAYQ